MLHDVTILVADSPSAGNTDNCTGVTLGLTALSAEMVT